MYHFIAGYTSKVAGTEMGIDEPVSTFSACFGAAFLPRHPTIYAEMLAEKIRENGSHVWLINTGWSGGKYGEGKRMDIKTTRTIIDAIHDGSLQKESYSKFEIFGFDIPDNCNGVDSNILHPKRTWKDKVFSYFSF